MMSNQGDPFTNTDFQSLEPVHENPADEGVGLWTRRLVLFLRVMAGISMIKGLYHWTEVCGIGAGSEPFENHSIAWQTATVFFAVIDLVAAVGLWLAAAWGAVIWLTSVISMIAVEMLFPQIYGGRIWMVIIEFVLLGTYLWLALKAAREQPV